MQTRAWLAPLVRRRMAALGAGLMLLVTLACGNQERSDSPHPLILVDDWVRVYPPGPPDTLTLRADGSVASVSRGVGTNLPLHFTHWRIGGQVVPTEGLCIGDGKTFSCQAYLVRGDTLALANQVHAVFIRSTAWRPESAPVAPTRPRVVPRAPRPGEGVRILRDT